MGENVSCVRSAMCSHVKVVIYNGEEKMGHTLFVMGMNLVQLYFYWRKETNSYEELFRFLAREKIRRRKGRRRKCEKIVKYLL